MLESGKWNYAGGTDDGIAMTGAGNLPANFIIHIAQEFDAPWQKLVRKALSMADGMDLGTIAFPALGTGKTD